MDGEFERILSSGDEGSAVIARTLALLYLASKKSGSSVKELAEAAGFPLATTYRIIRQLQKAGFVIETDGAIHAGGRLTDTEAGDNEHLVIFAAPLLRRLSSSSRLTSLLTVRVNTLALTLDGVHAGRFGSPVFRVGETRPLYAAASATPLLAYSAPDVIDRVQKSNQKKYTANTPDAQTLLEKIKTIKDRGFDHTLAEVQAGWAGVGVPVFYGREAIACLSLVAPSSQMPREISSLVEMLKQTSHDLTAKLATANTRFIWNPNNPQDNDNEEP